MNSTVYQIRIFSLFVLLALLLMACSKNEVDPSQGIIPEVYVNFEIEPNGINFIMAGGWKSFDGEGYRGIIIYRVDQFTFNAYERACPYDPEKECAQVEIDASGLLLIDSCCMSKYNILDGSPIDGPTQYPLKQYFTEYNGNRLHIYSN